MQPGALFSSNAGSPYRGLPQDDTSFTKKFLGFASPPHDGFADKFSIVTKENLQAVYAAHPPCAFIIHDERPLVKLFLIFLQIVDLLRRIVVFFTAYAYEKALENQGLLGR